MPQTYRITTIGSDTAEHNKQSKDAELMSIVECHTVKTSPSSITVYLDERDSLQGGIMPKRDIL